MATVTTAQTVTDLATSPDPTQTYFSRKLLTRAKYYDYFSRWAEDIMLPMNEGLNVIVRRWLHLAMALTALTQGVPPTGKTPALDDFTAALGQYGDFIAASDFMRWTEIDPALNDWVSLLGEQAGYTIDTVKRNVADAGTNVQFSNGTARGQVTSIVNGNYFDRAQTTMMANGAEMPIGGMAASTGVGTAPTLPGYPCVIHPFTYRTVKNLSGFVTPAQNARMPEGCVGCLGMVYFYVSADPSAVSAGSRVRASGGGASTTVRNTSGTVDVYEDIFFSRRGFNTVKLSGKSLMNYVKPVGSAGALDPLEQVGTIGWKATTVSLITNQLWILRGEHATEL